MSKYKRLSHSAIARYLTCPFSFDAYYNQGIRPEKIGSALVFGSAMDAALNALLLDSGKPSDAYRKVWSEYDESKIEFSRYDHDPDLGTTVQASLFQKAKLLVEEYRRVVLPNIERVIEVQAPVGPGFLDALVEWKGRGKIILDHKTASRPYPENACDYSAQLAMYAAEKQISQVAFVVLIKQIQKNRQKVCSECGNVSIGRHKTCNAMAPMSRRLNKDHDVRCGGEWTETIHPTANIQIIHGDIGQRALEVAAEVEENVKQAIKEKLFHCNVGQCNNQYGKPCAYKDLKWFGSMENLIKVERRK